jgi:hypothetical protein
MKPVHIGEVKSQYHQEMQIHPECLTLRVGTPWPSQGDIKKELTMKTREVREVVAEKSLGGELKTFGLCWQHSPKREG